MFCSGDDHSANRHRRSNSPPLCAAVTLDYLTIIPCGISVGLTSAPVTMTLQGGVGVGETLVFDISLDDVGSIGSVVNNKKLTFLPGQTSKTFSITAGFQVGPMTVTYAMSGNGAAQYIPPGKSQSFVFKIGGNHFHAPAACRPGR